MKKSLVIGAATLAITAMVGTGFGSASSQDEKGGSAFSATATPAKEVTAEERAVLLKEQFEMEGISLGEAKLPEGATAEEIAIFEKEVLAIRKEVAENGFESASSQYEKDGTENFGTATPAKEVTDEEREALLKEGLEAEGTPLIALPDEATAEEIAIFEKEVLAFRLK